MIRIIQSLDSRVYRLLLREEKMPVEDNKDSETLAVLLGLKKVPEHPMNKYEGDELGRMVCIRTMAETLLFSNDSVFALSIFSANYLPQLVDKFLDPPQSPHLSQDLQDELKLNNAYFQIIYLLRHALCPYMMKYIRSDEESASKNILLAKVITERLLKVAPIWERLGYLKDDPEHWFCNPEGRYTFMVLPAIQAVWMIKNMMRSYMRRTDQEQLLPLELKIGLACQAKTWAKRYADSVYGRLWWILGTSPEEDKASRFVTQGLLGRWHVCALETCSKDDEDGLRLCGRCKTVKYCCSAHQKEHWKKEHKYCCFETTY